MRKLRLFLLLILGDIGSDEPAGPGADWILVGGTWHDNGIWIDEASWID